MIPNIVAGGVPIAFVLRTAVSRPDGPYTIDASFRGH
jgi:hypothetical protein